MASHRPSRPASYQRLTPSRRPPRRWHDALQTLQAITGGGDRWAKDDHLDHLMMFVGELERREIETVHGDATAAHVDYIVCVDCPQVWTDQLVFGRRPRPSADRRSRRPRSSSAGSARGWPSRARSPPWTLDDPTDDDLAKAETFLERYATHLPSGTLVIDVKAIEADPEPTTTRSDATARTSVFVDRRAAELAGERAIERVSSCRRRSSAELVAYGAEACRRAGLAMRRSDGRIVDPGVPRSILDLHRALVSSIVSDVDSWR